MDSTEAQQNILRGVMDRWKSAVGAHEPQQVASCFTEDAIFQGLRPYSVGRQGVAVYYDSQPLGLTADYEVLATTHYDLVRPPYAATVAKGVNAAAAQARPSRSSDPDVVPTP